MIIISYAKENKNEAKRLVSKLESSDYKCWIEPRNLSKEIKRKDAVGDAIKQADLMIIIFSSYTNDSEDIVEQYDLAFEEEVPIIPFVVSDLKLTISVQHLLNTHDWINAFDTSFNEAVEDLIDLLESDESEAVVEKSAPKRKTNTNAQPSNRKQAYIIGTIAASFVVILVAILFWPDNNGSDEGLVGTWYLANYEDNGERSPDKMADYLAGIDQLKRKFSFKLNDDNTFERRGFAPKPEYGTWSKFSNNGKNFLKIAQEKSKNGEGDILLIKEFEDDKLVLAISSNNKDSTQIITTLYLTKK